MTDSTCWTLIEGAADGGELERELFARRYGPVVKAYLLARWQGRSNGADLDDALQDVFLECFKRGGALERAERRRQGGFRAFLHGITSNVASRCEARRARGPMEGMSSDTAMAAASPAGAAPDRVFERAWALATVREALERHRELAASIGPEALRRFEILRLRFAQGRPIREIAPLVGIASARVHHEYARGRREFEDALRAVVGADLVDSGERVTEECRALLAALQDSGT